MTFFGEAMRLSAALVVAAVGMAISACSANTRETWALAEPQIVGNPKEWVVTPAKISGQGVSIVSAVRLYESQGKTALCIAAMVSAPEGLNGAVEQAFAKSGSQVVIGAAPDQIILPAKLVTLYWHERSNGAKTIDFDQMAGNCVVTERPWNKVLTNKHLFRLSTAN